ncbi:DUF2624 family protein [Desertibacillus haloalkaliphilus]|uniref:DUF2624 family protein n=1 Tax=Desertibacillus haloalkaliphilus TaxID=1328930 RepID=UPI001FE70D5B|nr:DUF2624 family protein [Desertibacillus haloalkaliphilus]
MSMINPVLQQMINAKLNSITKAELMQLSQQYQLPITERQAERIIQILRAEPIDILNEKQRERIINQIKTEIDQETAKKAEQLLQQFQHML